MCGFKRTQPSWAVRGYWGSSQSPDVNKAQAGAEMGGAAGSCPAPHWPLHPQGGGRPGSPASLPRWLRSQGGGHLCGGPEPHRMRAATGRGCGLRHALSAQQPWGRRPHSGALGSGFWSESQLHLFLPAPGGEAQTSPVSWCRLRGRLFRASWRFKWKQPELPGPSPEGVTAQLSRQRGAGRAEGLPHPG